MNHGALPKADVLIGLPYVLGVSADWLLSGRGEKMPAKKEPFADLLALADDIRAASELLNREKSAAQACAETEGRLADLRKEEASARAAVDLAKVQADSIVAGANSEAARVRELAEADLEQIKADAQKAIDDAKSERTAAVAKLAAEAALQEARRDDLVSECAGLESKRVELETKLAALREAIASVLNA